MAAESSTGVPRRTHAAPNERNTVGEPACAVTPCVVCLLRQALRDEGVSEELASTDLQVNVVGVRTEDSVSDKFDDHIYLIVRQLGSAARDAFEARVTDALRDAWRREFPGWSESTRIVACSADRATWVVFHASITTDPGLDHGLEFQIDARSRALSKARRSLGEKRQALDRGGIKKARERALRGAVAQLETSVSKLEGEVAHLQRRADAVRANQIQTGESASGLEEGRAMLATGDLVRSFRLGIHHQTPQKFGRSHTALVSESVPSVRHYYGATLEKRRGVANAAGGSSPPPWTVRYWYSDGKPPRDEPEDTTIAEGPDDTLIIRSAAGTEPLLPHDAFGVAAMSAGVNIHRAHKVRLAASGGLELGAGGEPSRVGDYSEGCQTFPSFAGFSAFIRMIAVSKQFGCAANGRSECARLCPSAAGEGLSAGEAAVVEKLGWIGVAQAARADKDHPPSPSVKSGLDQYCAAASAAAGVLRSSQAKVKTAKRIEAEHRAGHERRPASAAVMKRWQVALGRLEAAQSALVSAEATVASLSPPMD